MMITSWNLSERYHTLKDDYKCYHRGEYFTIEGTEKLRSYFYGMIPMLCRSDLVNNEQITHCERALIWSPKNTVEIRYMEGCRYTEPLKNGGTPWKHNLQKAVDLQKNVNVRS